MLQHSVEICVAMAEQVHTQLQPHSVVTLVIRKLDECDDFLEWFEGCILFHIVPTTVADFVQQLQEFSVTHWQWSVA